MFTFLFMGYAFCGLYTLQLISDEVGLDFFITTACLQRPDMLSWPYWYLKASLCITIVLGWPKILQNYSDGDYFL
jgi:hypothetical protein